MSLAIWLTLAVSGETPACGAVPMKASTPWAGFHESELPLRTTVFLNFNGGYIAHPILALDNRDNSAEDRSILVPLEGVDFPAYAGGEQNAVATVQAVQADLDPFGVRVMYLERPNPRLPYTMVMMGGEPDLVDTNDQFSGVAPIDCTLDNTRHIVYAFNDEGTPAEQANIVSHEFGHAWGLDHALGPDELMSYAGVSGDKGFTDECRDYCITSCSNGAILCTERHEEFCPAGQQNAVAELLHIFGGSDLDTEPPTVAFMEPVDGAMLDAGADLVIEAEIGDDFGNFGWDLTIERDGEAWYEGADYSGIPSWYFAAPQPGEYRLILTAEDHADHVTTAEITVTIGAPEAGTSDGAGETTTDDNLESESGSDEDSDGGLPAQDEPDDGCSCRYNSAPSPWLLVIPVLLRRRSKYCPALGSPN